MTRLHKLATMLTAALCLCGLVLALSMPAQAQDADPVRRIKTDTTLINHKVYVKGTVEQVQPDNPGSSRGKFILRDMSGDEIMVRTDWLPAPASNVSLWGVVSTRVHGGVYLREMRDNPWYLRPLTLIVAGFVLVMAVLLYFLFKPEPQDSVELAAANDPFKVGAAPPPPDAQAAAAMPPPVGGAPLVDIGIITEDYDLAGTLKILADGEGGKLAGREIALGNLGTGKILGRGAEIDVPDKTFSRQSARLSVDASGRVQIKNLKKNKQLTIQAPGGQKTVLGPDQQAGLDDGDVIEQERCGLRLEFNAAGDKTVDM